jgi:glycosyltransferase involved in cell wall biosynthesis
MKYTVTIIIPAFNDAEGLAHTLEELLPFAEKYCWSIIVVDDCSTDKTADIAANFTGKRVTLLRNLSNLGYGASIKRGILAAKTTFVATMDADGQHRVEDLLQIVSELDDSVDAVIGVRTVESHMPLFRRPGKWILKHTANFLSNSKIPDINCGLRIFRRDIIIQFFSFVSDRFSFSTSCLISLLRLNCNVRYTHVTIKKRIGKSSVKQMRDGLYTLMLIIRLIFLFKPMRILFPIAIIVASLGIIFLFIHIFIAKMTVTTILVWLSGFFLFLFCLLADQVSGMRRDFIVREINNIKNIERERI